MDGPGVKEVLTMLQDMWEDGVIPESAEADTGANFQATFETGTIGMQGSGGFAIAALKANHPEIDFGIAPLPGINEGERLELRRRRRHRHPDRAPSTPISPRSSSSGS